MAFTAKQILLAVLPKVSGTLSFIGSSIIFQDVIRNKKRRNTVYSRLMLGLSTFDVMASIVNIMSTWSIPSDVPNLFGSSGTTATCTAQGFFNETGNVTTPVYNTMLCVYFTLIIRKGWTEKQIQKYEPILHAIPLGIGWTMGITGLPLKLYNPSGWLCWFAPFPAGCGDGAGQVPCERGELAHLFRWIHYGIIWSSIFFMTVAMFLIYRFVRQQEMSATKYRLRPGSVTSDTASPPKSSCDDNRRKTRQVANQALLFCGALYLTWIFTTLTRIFQTVQGITYFPLLVLMSIFFPLQGFFNCLIYLRPRYLKERRKSPEKSFLANFIAAIKSGDSRESSNTFSSSTLASIRTRISSSKIFSSLIPSFNGQVDRNETRVPKELIILDAQISEDENASSQAEESDRTKVQNEEIEMKDVENQISGRNNT